MITKTALRLSKFDPEFFNTLPGSSIIPTSNIEGRFHVLKEDKDKIGVAGVTQRGKHNYFQVVIHPDHRGKGYVRKSADALVRRYRLPELIATINKTNLPSIRAVTHAGFTESDYHTNRLSDGGKKEPNTIIMAKNYQPRKGETTT